MLLSDSDYQIAYDTRARRVKSLQREVKNFKPPKSVIPVYEYDKRKNNLEGTMLVLNTLTDSINSLRNRFGLLQIKSNVSNSNVSNSQTDAALIKRVKTDEGWQI